jgi:hypothetical protein
MLFGISIFLCAVNLLQAAAQLPAGVEKEQWCNDAIQCYGKSSSEWHSIDCSKYYPAHHTDPANLQPALSNFATVMLGLVSAPAPSTAQVSMSMPVESLWNAAIQTTRTNVFTRATPATRGHSPQLGLQLAPLF